MPEKTAKTEIPTDKAHSVLEAGYYHIRHQDVPLADIPSSPAEPDTAYLLQLKSGKSAPDLPEGVISFQDKGDTYILVPSGSSRPTLHPDDVSGAQKLDIKSPEAADLAYGLTHHGSKIAKVAVLVDDFGLPPGIRDHLDKLMPASYAGILAACAELEDKEPLLVSEREARNQGSRRVKSELDKISKASAEPGTPTTVKSEELYAKRGFVMGDRPAYGADTTVCGNGALVFSTPYLADMKSRHKGEYPFGVIQRPYAGLTRTTDEDSGAFVPACAVLHMGMIKRLKEAGYSNIISVSDQANDGHIHNKCFEGAVMAAHFLDEPPQGKGAPIKFENTVITYDPMFGDHVITRINSQDVRNGYVKQESCSPAEFEASLASPGEPPQEKHPSFAEFVASTQALPGHHRFTVLQDGVRMEVTSLNTPAPSCAVPSPEITGASNTVGTPGNAGTALPRAEGFIKLPGEERGGAARG